MSDTTETQPGATSNPVRGKGASIQLVDATGKPLPGSVPIPVEIDAPSVPALPVRLQLALAGVNHKGLVLRSTSREARDSLREDRLLLRNVGLLDEAVKISVAHGTLIFANGSRIDYIGGEPRSLDEAVRGMRAHHIDGVDLISDQAASYITIRQA